MTIKKIFPAALLACSPLLVSAQESQWSQSLSVGLNIARGNTESTQFSGAYDGKKTMDRSDLNLKAKGTFGEENNTKTTDNYAFAAKYRREISDRFFWFINGTYEADNIAKLDNRITLGPGLGYRIYETEVANLDFEAGLGYNREKYEGFAADDSLGYRVGESYERHLSTTSKVWQSAYVTGPTDEADDYVITAELGVQAKVASNLSLKSVLADTYANDPIVGNKKNDLSITTMLVYSF